MLILLDASNHSAAGLLLYCSGLFGAGHLAVVAAIGQRSVPGPCSPPCVSGRLPLISLDAALGLFALKTVHSTVTATCRHGHRWPGSTFNSAALRSARSETGDSLSIIRSVPAFTGLFCTRICCSLPSICRLPALFVGYRTGHLILDLRRENTLH